MLAGQVKGIVQRHDPHLLVIGANNAHLTGANFAINPDG
jgi:hypothetical protein